MKHNAQSSKKERSSSLDARRFWRKFTLLALAVLLIFGSIPTFALNGGGVLPDGNVEETADNFASEKTSVSSEDYSAFGEAARFEIAERLAAGDVLFEITSLREESVKHFRLEDGTFAAVQYADAVHRRATESEPWREIDNTLTLKNGKYVSEIGVSFVPALSENGNIYTFSDGKYGFSVSVNGGFGNSNALVVNPITTTANTLDELIAVDKTARILYPDALGAGVDLEYVLVGNEIKENIILRANYESYVYSFTISLILLDAATTKENGIELVDAVSGEAKYLIPAPYMFDANGETSSAVGYTLEKSGDAAYRLTVKADAAWVNSEERAWPVTVDPTVRTGQYVSNILDTYINTADAATTNHGSETSFVMGKKSVSGTLGDCYAYVRILGLPTVLNYPNIAVGTIELQISKLATPSEVPSLKAWRVLNDWNENTLTKSNQPSYDSINVLCEDLGPYSTIGSVLPYRISLDWLNVLSTSTDPLFNTLLPYGVRIGYSTQPTSEKYAGFYASENTNLSTKPVIIISYSYVAVENDHCIEANGVYGFVNVSNNYRLTSTFGPSSSIVGAYMKPNSYNPTPTSSSGISQEFRVIYDSSTRTHKLQSEFGTAYLMFSAESFISNGTPKNAYLKPALYSDDHPEMLFVQVEPGVYAIASAIVPNAVLTANAGEGNAYNEGVSDAGNVIFSEWTGASNQKWKIESMRTTLPIVDYARTAKSIKDPSLNSKENSYVVGTSNFFTFYCVATNFGQSVTWSSSNTSVITVAAGKLTSKTSPGMSTITATLKDDTGTTVNTWSQSISVNENWWTTTNTLYNATPLAGNIAYDYGIKYYKFTPTVSGKYEFFTEGSTDTIGYLYSADFAAHTQTYITSNDDGNGYPNFKITADLVKGQTYLLDVHGWNTTTGGYTLYVECTRFLEITSSVSSITNGNGAQFSARYYDNGNYYTSGITWSTSNPTLTSISTAGYVSVNKALPSATTFTVTASKTISGVTQSASVTVTIPAFYGARGYVASPYTSSPTINCQGYAFGTNNIPAFCTQAQWDSAYNDSSTSNQAQNALKPYLETWLNSNFSGRWADVTNNGGINAPLESNQYLVAFRVGRDNIEMDYHFWYRTNTGQWANKHGKYNASELLPTGDLPTNNSSSGWSLGPKSQFYNSAIIYYRITVI